MRVGFLGTGSMGLSHVKLIGEEFPHIELAAICDPFEENLRKAKEAAPVARVCGDLKELLAAGIDGVFVSTPDYQHVEQVEQCLAAGKHVFAEKPTATTREGCRRMVELAAAHPKQVVLIHHELRYSKYFGKIKELVAAGEVGEVQLVWCKEFRGPFLKKVGDWIQDRRQSGGTLVDKNCHHFDLMNWWVGARPKRVCGFGGKDVVSVIGGEHEVIDHASASFEYENGVRGGLLLCMFAPKMGEDLEMGVIGSKGVVQTRMSRDEIWQWRRGQE